MQRKALWRAWIVSLALGATFAATHSPARAQDAAGGVVWPNRESKTNSDDWIRLHHNEIKQMRPRVLVLNFVNGLSEEEAKKKAESLATVIRESTRYHGYKDTAATPFLDYQIYRVAQITDPAPLPEGQRLDGNSSLYPRMPNWKPGMPNLQYSALFSEKFAEYYQEPSKNNPAEFLSLSEMVGKGVVHEVWILALQGNIGAPYPCTEIKQVYDETLHKVKDKSVQAGVGGMEEQIFLGRSLRILHINPEKGPGCALETLGTALEAMAQSNAVPYFTRYFNEFAGFDLKQRYRLPFDAMHKRGDIEVEYPEAGRLVYRIKGEAFSVRNYVALGGSVRYCPTSRRDFEMDNRTAVLSSIENFRMKNGLKGADKAELWTPAKFAKYQAVAGDCVGPWMIYWRQSMPGYENKAIDDNNRPMKNWWPFLFY